MGDLLVAEDLASAETTSAMSQVAAANPLLPRSTSPGAKLHEGSKHPPSEVTASARAVVMTCPVAAHVNGDSNMDISSGNALSYAHGYVLVLLAFL